MTNKNRNKLSKNNSKKPIKTGWSNPSPNGKEIIEELYAQAGGASNPTFVVAEWLAEDGVHFLTGTQENVAERFRSYLPEIYPDPAVLTPAHLDDLVGIAKEIKNWKTTEGSFLVVMRIADDVFLLEYDRPTIH